MPGIRIFTGKYPEFVFEHSGIQEIENLHHHEGVEDEGEVSGGTEV